MSAFSNKTLLTSPAAVKQKHGHNYTYQSDSYHSSSSSSFNKSIGEHTTDWHLYRTDNYLQDSNYVCMFGPEVQEHWRVIVEKMLVAKEMELERAYNLERDIELRHKGFVKYIKWLLMASTEDACYDQELASCKKIPDILDNMLLSISYMFEVTLVQYHVVKCITHFIFFRLNFHTPQILHQE